MGDLNNLIPELENIVGEYSATDDYKKLHLLNPNIHTHDKLILKQLSHIPENDLLLYSEMYKLALEFNNVNTDIWYFCPPYLTALFIQFKLLYPNFNSLTDLKRINNNYGNLFDSIVYRSAKLLKNNIMSGPFTDSGGILDAYKSELILFMRNNISYESEPNDETIEDDLENIIEEAIDEIVLNFFNDKHRYIDTPNLYLNEYITVLYKHVLQNIIEIRDNKHR